MNYSVTGKYIEALVAQYLKKNGFEETLSSFLKEASLPLAVVDDEEQLQVEDDLETIVADRIKFNEHSLALKMGRLKLNDNISESVALFKSWNHTVKFTSVLKRELNALTIAAQFCNDNNEIILSMSNREILLYNADQFEQVSKLSQPSNNAGISKLCGTFNDENSSYYYATSMNGMLTLYDATGAFIDNATWKIHDKMITHIKIWKCNMVWYVISTGLDNCLKLSCLNLPKDGIPSLKTTCEEKLSSSCTALELQFQDFTEKDILVRKPMILITKEESTQLSCFTVATSGKLELLYNLALNNTQFTSHSFTVRDMVTLDKSLLFKPSLEEKYLAIVTSHVPYMRLILVRLPTSKELQDRELRSASETSYSTTLYGNIVANMVTKVGQDGYSQPILKKLEQLNGLVVGANDGLYAIDIANGDSWRFRTTNEFKHDRVKCLDVNQDGSMIVVGMADRSIYELATK